jgi:uncharacterized protein YydD (DUF2326 family)
MDDKQVAQALSLMLTATTTAATAIAQAQSISAVVQRAQSEGRSTLTDAEWKEITDADDAARKTLQDAISKAP